MLFCRLLIFFSKSIFLDFFWKKKSVRNTIRVSNSLDPDQARRFVGPDLGPNCLQKLPADDARRQRVNIFNKLVRVYFRLFTFEKCQFYGIFGLS